MKSDKWITHALFGHLGAVEQVTLLEWKSGFLKNKCFCTFSYLSFFSGLLVKHSLFSALLKKLRLPGQYPIMADRESYQLECKQGELLHAD